MAASLCMFVQFLCNITNIVFCKCYLFGLEHLSCGQHTRQLVDHQRKKQSGQYSDGMKTETLKQPQSHSLRISFILDTSRAQLHHLMENFGIVVHYAQYRVQMLRVRRSNVETSYSFAIDNIIYCP